MNTGRKISLIYSGITIGLVLITGLIFFFCVSNYTDNIYFQYLEEKAHAVAEEKFSEDELDPVKYQNVVLRRKNSIPTSKELFINVKDRKKAEKALSTYLNEEEILSLFSNKTINFEKNQEVGTAFLYYDNTGTFAVVVLSRNPFIDDINDTLRWALILLLLVAGSVLYLISRLYAMRVLNRIDQDYQTEKMFVNNASHEINNPLTAIQGECEVALLKDRQPAEYKDILNRISMETNRIIVIMKELLQFSHARGSQLDPHHMEEISISALLSQESLHGIELHLVDDFTLHTDVELLRIAIDNLISNARKYSQGSPVIITTQGKQLIVEDQGIGIPPSDLKNIFRPFFRATNTGSVVGRGVGLALAKSILEKLHAQISVTSQEGVGTKFIVSF